MHNKDYYSIVDQSIKEIKKEGGAHAELATSLEKASKSFGGYRTLFDNAREKVSKLFTNLEAKLGGTKGTSIQIEGQSVAEAKSKNLGNGTRSYPSVDASGEITGAKSVNGFSSNQYDPKASAAQIVEQSRNEIDAVTAPLKEKIRSQGITIAEFFGQGFHQGLIDTIPELKAVVEKLGHTAPEKLKEILQIASPSQVGLNIGENFGTSVTTGIQDALPGMEKAGQNLANVATTSISDRFASNGAEIHAALLSSTGTLLNNQIPLFENAGTKMGTAFTESVNLPIKSIGSDIHADMLAAIEQASGMTMAMHAAGLKQGEAFKSGFQQGELNLTSYTQEMLPGMANAGAANAWIPKESPMQGPSMESGQFVKNKGFFGNLKGRMTTPEGKMNMQTKMAGSTAIMMGGSALTGMLPKGSNASNIAGSVSSMAGMGMMFGPWGAAAGAAIGLVTGGIGALMKAEKEHQAVVKASFTASTAAISMFGGKVIETKNEIVHFNDALKKSGITSKQSLSEVNQMANAIAKLGKGDSTKVTADAIKKYNGVGPVVGTLKQFAAAQVAAGMDPKGVAKMVAAMLQYAGKTQYLKQALKEIVPATQSVGAAQQTLLTKLTAAAGATNISWQINRGYIKTYKDMDTATKNLADGFGTVGMSMLNSNADSKTLLASMKALDGSTLDAYTSGTLLAAKLKQMGQTDLADRLTTINATVKDTGKSMLIATAEADGLIANLDKLALTKLMKDPKAMADLAAQIDKFNKDAAKAAAAQAAADAKAAAAKAAAEATAADAAAKAKIFKGTAEEQAAKKVLSAHKADQNAVLKGLKDQLSQYQKQAAELKRIRDLDQQRADINNQMKTAMISGDFLGAANLAQARSSLQVDFNNTTMENKMQGQIDKVQLQADVFSQALADLTDAISQGIKVLDPNIKAVSKTAVLKPGPVSADTGPSIITQNFVINGGDTQAVHQTVTAATKAATGKQVASKHVVSHTKSGHSATKPKITPHGARSM